MKLKKVKEVLTQLKQDGWYLHKTRGSHRQLKHPEKPGKVTIPGKESDDLFGDILKSIENQSGIEF